MPDDLSRAAQRAREAAEIASRMQPPAVADFVAGTLRRYANALDNGHDQGAHLWDPLVDDLLSLPSAPDRPGYGEAICRRCDVQAAFCPCDKPDVEPDRPDESLLAYLLGQYERLLAAVEHIRMDTPEDRSHHETVINTFRRAAEPVRRQLAASPARGLVRTPKAADEAQAEFAEQLAADIHERAVSHHLEAQHTEDSDRRHTLLGQGYEAFDLKQILRAKARELRGGVEPIELTDDEARAALLDERGEAAGLPVEGGGQGGAA